MPLDLAAMLRNAIFETKTRLHSLEQALKHVAGAEGTTPPRKGGRSAATSKRSVKQATATDSSPAAKKGTRRNPPKKSKRKRATRAKPRPSGPSGS